MNMSCHQSTYKFTHPSVLTYHHLISLIFSDYHDIISVRMFEQEFVRVQDGTGITMDPRQREPYAQNVAAPRDHIDQPPASKLGWIGTTVLVILGGALCVLVLWFGVIFVNHRQQMSRKRFY